MRKSNLIISEQNKTKRKKNNRYQEDEEYRNRLRTQSRERYHKDNNYRIAALERTKKRYKEDEEYKKITIQRAKKRYIRLKIERLVKSKFLSFIIQKRNIHYNKRVKNNNEYEVCLVLDNNQRLQEINSFLKNVGFKLGKSFQKNNQYFQIIKDKEAVEVFQSLKAK